MLSMMSFRSNLKLASKKTSRNYRRLIKMLSARLKKCNYYKIVFKRFKERLIYAEVLNKRKSTNRSCFRIGWDCWELKNSKLITMKSIKVHTKWPNKTQQFTHRHYLNPISILTHLKSIIKSLNRQLLI